MATIKEIAKRAVCKYNDQSPMSYMEKPKVSPANIQKIEESLSVKWAMSKNYRPRVLNKEKSQLLAVVNYHKDFVISIIGDPFMKNYRVLLKICAGAGLLFDAIQQRIRQDLPDGYGLMTESLLFSSKK